MRIGISLVAALALLGAASPQAAAQLPQPKPPGPQEPIPVRPDNARPINPPPVSNVTVYRVTGSRGGASLGGGPSLTCRNIAADGRVTRSELAQWNANNCGQFYSTAP